jgi:lipid-A-disaccharide synthase
MKRETLYIVAGELSGDTHAAGMLRALAEERPGVKVLGFGGPAMAAECEGVRNWVEDAAVVGVWEVLRHYGWFREQFQKMLGEIRREKPQVLVLVDYPGFNLRLAKAVREELPKTRIIYYISPQVWAWNKRRVKPMAETLDEMLCVFPFEKEIFESAGLPTQFVGHPLVDELEPEKEDAGRDDHLVGLFPGSREREVGRLFPLMVDAAKRLRIERPETRFEAPAASPRLAETMRKALEREPELPLRVLDGGAHDLMQRACCGVIASGTATLEAACFGLPHCLVYKVAWPTYFLGRMLVDLPHIGLVNILAGREVAKEFIQGDADPCQAEHALRRFLDDPGHRAKTGADLRKTAALLGESGAHRRVARAVAKHFR